jgi:hypothetical protein
MATYHVQFKQKQTTTHQLSMETATIIIRFIRSFEYRNIRNVVLKNVSLLITTEELKTRIIQELSIAPGLPPPFRKYDYDTLKVFSVIFKCDNVFGLFSTVLYRLNTMHMVLKQMIL